ncbi:hypothetical protein JYU34_003490 [Plutella xylostella]|uniref:Uncharacterized protein n=1 Tax=Plutella xylostella TaxID=51655 RepID=A0ABQ7R062_PLUXY|nr:hypothetical protein JYU34_003490 [Plutella xylostella]
MLFHLDLRASVNLLMVFRQGLLHPTVRQETVAEFPLPHLNTILMFRAMAHHPTQHLQDPLPQIALQGTAPIVLPHHRHSLKHQVTGLQLTWLQVHTDHQTVHPEIAVDTPPQLTLVQ